MTSRPEFKPFQFKVTDKDGVVWTRCCSPSDLVWDAIFWLFGYKI